MAFILQASVFEKFHLNDSTNVYVWAFFFYFNVIEGTFWKLLTFKCNWVKDTGKYNINRIY